MPEELDWTTSPTACFIGLETALRRGDLHTAAQMQDHLAALGFTVKIDAAGRRRLHPAPRTHRELERKAAELRLDLAGRDARAIPLQELRDLVRAAEEADR
jgi:hypothetical protein